mmetsp:Transcript_35786/g.99182  ORF Transcript_35786/g.99182 Transcript_35786/m.99182 type:complete len:246 (-) Transcript_35786:106-843(-)
MMSTGFPKPTSAAWICTAVGASWQGPLQRLSASCTVVCAAMLTALLSISLELAPKHPRLGKPARGKGEGKGASEEQAGSTCRSADLKQGTASAARVCIPIAASLRDPRQRVSAGCTGVSSATLAALLIIPLIFASEHTKFGMPGLLCASATFGLWFSCLNARLCCTTEWKSVMPAVFFSLGYDSSSAPAFFEARLDEECCSRSEWHGKPRRIALLPQLLLPEGTLGVNALPSRSSVFSHGPISHG